jgi:feruloyl-CoA synthase
MSDVKFRDIKFGVTRVVLKEDDQGTQYVKAEVPLEPFANRLIDRLIYWAQKTPNKTLFARRAKNADGALTDWRHVTFSQAQEAARHIAQGLINRGLSAERPVLILSENDLEHALLALGCMTAGIPFCSASPAYSTISQDFDKLRHIIKTLTPGLVFAASKDIFEKAITRTVPLDVELVLTTGSILGYKNSSFNELLTTPITQEVDQHYQATGPQTVVKFLFTSGSTKLPKAVINTNLMWCSNQQQMRQSMPLLNDHSPVLVDWLPWNHTFGGNHNFGLVIYNGGTMYIDDGKPTSSLIGETIRNLRELSPTVYFNVPTGFELIANAMKSDPLLRQSLLSKVRMFFYAGASLAQPIWDSLYESQVKEIGERIAMTTGLGMTESGPFALFVTSPHAKTADIGVPAPGMEIKLIKDADKIEIRYKGPNVTPGYWRDPQETEKHFDAEGFFSTGDAVKWIDENNIHLGLKFDGRIAEDFKLATGTFVSVGPLRAKIIAAGAPYIQDVVITGLDQKEVGAMVFTTPVIRVLGELDHQSSLAEVLATKKVMDYFQGVLNDLAAHATGSANRISRLLLLSDPPSIDKGEITDKGSINQRAVLKHRDPLVQGLHKDTLQNILKPQ